MLSKLLLSKPLFILVAIVMAIAFVPVTALHWVAPNWEGLTQAQEIVGRLAGAAKEPGYRKGSPYFQAGDAQFSWEPGECWSFGFAKQNLTADPVIRANILNGRYAVAGYASDVMSTGIADDLFAKAVYLDDNTRRGGILYASVDCIGLSNTDVNRIRALVWDWARAAGIRSIQVAATHTHAGIDTIGMWRFRTLDGKDPQFQRLLIEKTALAMREAYENRQNGELHLAGADAGNLIGDGRPPYVFDRTITRFRFHPTQGGGPDFYMINAGCHPELAGSRNPIVSADFPAYMSRYILEATGAESMFIQGAQGAMITANRHRGVDQLQPYGEEFARRVLDNAGEEIELPALLNITSVEFGVPIDNPVFLAAQRIGMLNHTAYRERGLLPRYGIACELSYLRLGDETNSIDILIQPGELAPELAMGGFLDAETSANGTEHTRQTLFGDLSGYPFASDRQVVFGLANNFIGYVLPENDFYVHRWLPYLMRGIDRFERNHYEETNSPGPKTARLMSEAWKALLDKVQ